MPSNLVDWAVSPEGDVNRYRVYRASSCAGPFTLLATVTHPQSSYLDTAPLIPTSAYKITAVDTENLESGFSNCMSYTIPDPPPPDPPVPGAVAVRQAVYGGLNIASYTWATAPISASTVVVFLFWRGDVTCTLSDSRGNTYTDCGSGRVARPGDGYAQAFYAKNVTGGGASVTATFSGGGATFMYMALVEVTGINTLTPIDEYASGVASSGTFVTTHTFSPTSTNGAIIAFADCSGTTLRDQIGGVNATTLLTIDEVTAIVEGILFTSSPGSNITARANTPAEMISGVILAVALQTEQTVPVVPPVLQTLLPATASIAEGAQQSFTATLDSFPTAIETAIVTVRWSVDLAGIVATAPASITFSPASKTASFTVTGLLNGDVTVSVAYRGVTKIAVLNIEDPIVPPPATALPIAKSARVAADTLSLWTDYLL